MKQKRRLARNNHLDTTVHFLVPTNQFDIDRQSYLRLTLNSLGHFESGLHS